MACYYPKRERRRAIWLFNHILKTRGGIKEHAKAKLKLGKVADANTAHISLKGRLAAKYDSWLIL